MMQAPSPRWCCPAGAGWPVPADAGAAPLRIPHAPVILRQPADVTT